MIDAGEADRLWLRASELRLIADDLEARARELRGGRQPLDHRRYFKLLYERDYAETVEWIGPERWPQGIAACDYCDRALHVYDTSHKHDSDEDEVCAHIEHRIPVSRGGTNDLANLTLACPRCNARKGTMTEHEFRVALAFAGLKDSDGTQGSSVADGAWWALLSLVTVTKTAFPQHEDRLSGWLVAVSSSLHRAEREQYEQFVEVWSRPPTPTDVDLTVEPF